MTGRLVGVGKPDAPGQRTLYVRIYEIVARIPRGRVATYGQVARLAGAPGHARQVGYALHARPEGSAIPWQRVINRKGQVSVRSRPGAADLQRAMLEAEGIPFDEGEAIALEKYQWQFNKASKRIRAAKPAMRRSRTAVPRK